MPHSQQSQQTQQACPTCRQPVIDTDLGEYLVSLRNDLAHHLDILEQVIDAHVEALDIADTLPECPADDS